MQQLEALLAPVVEDLGFEFWGLEYFRGRNAVLRIYIDGEDGVTVDDCADVSHQVSGVLDVEDPLPGEYLLEVSSPGLDRPLFTLAQWSRFPGARVQVRLLAPVDGRRKFTGRLKAVNGEVLVFDHDGETLHVPHAQVERANLVPEPD